MTEAGNLVYHKSCLRLQIHFSCTMAWHPQWIFFYWPIKHPGRRYTSTSIRQAAFEEHHFARRRFTQETCTLRKWGNPSKDLCHHSGLWQTYRERLLVQSWKFLAWECGKTSFWSALSDSDIKPFKVLKPLHIQNTYKTLSWPSLYPHLKSCLACLDPNRQNPTRTLPAPYKNTTKTLQVPETLNKP